MPKPVTTPSISQIGVLYVGADHCEVRRDPDGTITTLDIIDAIGSVTVAIHIEGDTRAAKTQALLDIARKIRQQALDLIAEDAPPVVGGIGWGRGHGIPSTHRPTQALDPSEQVAS